MTKDKQIMFYAYPSAPATIGEDIKEFAKQIRQGGICDVRTWEDMEVSGLKITPQIIKKIDNCDIFGCDLTVLNPNVLFELGYAIGKSKKIFVSLNGEKIGASERYRSIPVLTNLGYDTYRNVSDLLSKFYESKIYERSYPSLSDDESLFAIENPIDIFVMKANSGSQAVTRIIDAVEESRLVYVVDDTSESVFNPLRWYSKNLTSCEGFLCQFMGSDSIGAIENNAKAALMSGMAYALGKKFLFIAPLPFSVPSDMPDFLYTYGLASEAYEITKSWLDNVRTAKQAALKRRAEYRELADAAKNLKKLRLGEIVAENEQNMLNDYFVDTGAYEEVIGGAQSIFVGRKGTGKSANFLSAQSFFESKRSNLVITIKPVGYEVEGLIKVLNKLTEYDKKDYFVEAMWKYLIYTEMAEKIIDRYRKDGQLIPPPLEKSLIEYMRNNDSLSDPSFSERINKVVSDVEDELSGLSEGQDIREVIGRVLHSGLMKRLKNILNSILKDYSSVVILVDNLDRAWSKGIDVEKMADVVFGLLSMTRVIPAEIQQEVKSKFGIDVKMAIFLRSDIYSILLEHAKERDKLEVSRIEWSDKETLERVIDERLMYFSGKDTPEEAWIQYFEDFGGQDSLKEIMLNYARPRPRDILVVTREAISSAISRGHAKVSEDDLKIGVRKYSRWAYESLLVEDDPNKGKLKDILNEFVNDVEIYTDSEVRKMIAAYCDDEDTEYYLNMLCDSHFLEIEIRKDKFQLIDDPDERRNKLIIAKKRADSENRPMRYKVSKPFHSWMEISEI